MLKPAYWKFLNFYMHEEPWKGSVPKVDHKSTTDGSDLGVIFPNTRSANNSFNSGAHNSFYRFRSNLQT